MSKGFEYTTMAHRHTARFPVLAFVAKQVMFWIWANILLITVLNLYALIISNAYHVPAPKNRGITVLVSIILGVVYGIGLGLTGYYMDRYVLKRMSLGRVLLIRTLTSLVLFVLALWFFRFFLFEYYLSASLKLAGLNITEQSWKYLFWLLLIYYFFMTLVIGFINQVNLRYGPGVVLPLLLGVYRQPREVERIFMFMDLKSSTATAEKLGHLKYSSFIRDCFADINDVLYSHQAQVYQYVGDQVVLMWPGSEGLKNHNCIRFFFAVKDRFAQRASYYTSMYSLLPVFKAGLHIGMVTAVEIGEVKRDIAYHGDTLNTGARIQSVCNDYDQELLVSMDLLKRIGEHEIIKHEYLGEVLLKGKEQKVGIAGLREVRRQT